MRETCPYEIKQLDKGLDMYQEPLFFFRRLLNELAASFFRSVGELGLLSAFAALVAVLFVVLTLFFFAGIISPPFTKYCMNICSCTAYCTTFDIQVNTKNGNKYSNLVLLQLLNIEIFFLMIC